VKRLLSLLLLVALPVALAACNGNGDQEDTSRRSVVAAFYPLVFIAQYVAGNEADVTSVTPAGVEPHDIELTSAQVRAITESDLLLYVGEDFQPSLEELLPEVENELDALEIDGADRPGDPHVWLDPVLMIAIAQQFTDQLAEADPRNARFYRTNLENLTARLNELDDDFQQGLSRCARREIVTSHSAFGYLADRYNLEQIGIAGIEPNQEPSARRLNEVSELVRDRGVTTIFFEALLPEDLAETVAGETGAQTAMLDPLESPPASGDYLSAMRGNLQALRAAMDCR
jgi:zinc transport system substrate-binding protein